MTSKKDKLNFKKSIEELEKINEWFSKEDIDLEEGLNKLKKGKDLILSCQKRLNEVETEFKDIKEELETQNEEDIENVDLESEELGLDFE